MADALAAKLRTHPIIKNFDPTKQVKIINQKPFPLLSYNPEAKKNDILKLIKPKDRIVIKTNEFTDKFTLVAFLENDDQTKNNKGLRAGINNPEVYPFDIGVTCPNANKKKIANPDVDYFIAEVDKVLAGTTGSDVARPVLATITSVFDHVDGFSEDFVEQLNPLITLENYSFDRRLRADEFKSLHNNSNNKIYTWPHQSFTQTFSASSNKDVLSYTRNRRKYDKMKCQMLVREAANLIKTHFSSINDIYHIAYNRLNEALKFVENDSNALTVRGALFIHMKKFQEAVIDLTKVYEKETEKQKGGNKSKDDNDDSTLQDAKMYLITALENQYKLEQTSAGLDILNQLRKVDPNHELLISEKERKEKLREQEKAEKKLILDRKRKIDELQADNLRVDSGASSDKARKLALKREALYKSILDTTKSFDTEKERREKINKDQKMSKVLDKDVSKGNLDDILAAIQHFDGGDSKKQLKATKKEVKEEF